MTYSIDKKSSLPLSVTPVQEAHPLLPCNAPPIIENNEQNELYGFFLMFLSSIFFSAGSFLAHIAEAFLSFPSPASAFIYGVVHTVLSLIYIILFRPKPHLLTNLPFKLTPLLIFRGFIGALDFVIFLKAVSLLPFGKAIAIVFCSPIFTLIFSFLILKERIFPHELVAGALCFLGVILICKPSTTPSAVFSHELLGSFFALFSAVCGSITFTSIRYLGTSIHYMVSIAVHSIALIMLAVPIGGMTSLAFIRANKEGFIISIVGTMASFVGQCFLNRSLQLSRAGPAVVIRNLDVPVAFLFGMMFLSEKPSLGVLVGSVLVVSGSLLVASTKFIRPSPG